MYQINLAAFFKGQSKFDEVPVAIRIFLISFSTIVLAGLFIGGSQPEVVGLFLPPVDKMAHAGIFGLLALLLWFGFNRRGAWWIFGIVVLNGLADEGHQLFLPGRDADWTDLMADFVGGGIVLILLTEQSLCFLFNILWRK
jgi:hypothetical protein